MVVYISVLNIYTSAESINCLYIFIKILIEVFGAQHIPPFHNSGCQQQLFTVSKWPPDLESFVITSHICCVSMK